MSGFEWDPRKAAANLRQHGVDFADAAGALEDDLGRTIPEPSTDLEERFVTLGSDPHGRLLVVVWTWRGERLRIISARRATGVERRSYESG